MDLLKIVDALRMEASHGDSEKKSRLGQFLTPAPIARLMASMFRWQGPCIRILDAGAGVGSLFSACVEILCSRKKRPKSVEVVAFELDPALKPFLQRTAVLCKAACSESGIEFTFRLETGDFLKFAAGNSEAKLFGAGEEFTAAIMNPPYFKIGVQSIERKLIRRLGLETTNIYAGFVAAAVTLLERGGELVAITPRSFCNGTYFAPFRKFLLERVALRRLHVFESRKEAFRDEAVLQENVIFHAQRGGIRRMVTVTSGTSTAESKRRVSYDRVIDGKTVIHVAANANADAVVEQYSRLGYSLNDLQIEVSTGRVVDFRVKDFLRKNFVDTSVPLIYPTHIREGFVRWPSENGKKCNAIIRHAKTEAQLLPNEYFVIVKRFSAKEERRRITAAVYDPGRLNCDSVGFENHLNFFHCRGKGLDAETAKGLAVFLNSSLADAYFRHFSGHTQVNASDLRMMRYPSLEQLSELAESVTDTFPTQQEIDERIAMLLPDTSTEFLRV